MKAILLFLSLNLDTIKAVPTLSKRPFEILKKFENKDSFNEDILPLDHDIQDSINVIVNGVNFPIEGKIAEQMNTLKKIKETLNGNIEFNHADPIAFQWVIMSSLIC